MKIYFGVNEYELVPGFDIPGADIDYVDQYIKIQILADEVSLGDFEDVVSDTNNLKSIRVVDEDNHTTTYFEGYTKIENLQKEFDVVYSIDQENNVELSPAILDPDSGEVIQEAIYGEGLVEKRADIIYLRVSKGSLVEQVEQNASNIEFIAIMSDIEL